MHLALLALDVGPGDEVITSPITWPATANVIEHCGATPVFCDVRDGRPQPRPVAPAGARHRADEGDPARPPRRAAVRPRPDPSRSAFPVVEDAAHAFESRYRGRKLGGLSDATCFSLYATKNVAAGEGGLVATNRDDVAERIRSMRLTRRGDGSRYDQVTSGFKANLSDVLAAIALVQLDKLEHHAAIRARQFGLYDDGLADLDGISPLARDPRDTHALHLYVVRIDAARAGATRDDYQRALARGADRDQHPLPAGAPPHVVPRAVSGAAAAARRRAGGRRGALAAALAGALRRGHPRRGRCRPPCPRPVHGMKPAAPDTG